MPFTKCNAILTTEPSSLRNFEYQTKLEVVASVCSFPPAHFKYCSLFLCGWLLTKLKMTCVWVLDVHFGPMAFTVLDLGNEGK